MVSKTTKENSYKNVSDIDNLNRGKESFGVCTLREGLYLFTEASLFISGFHFLWDGYIGVEI